MLHFCRQRHAIPIRYYRMMAMNIDRFLQLAVDSRLLGSDALQNALDEFLGGSRAPTSKGSDVVAFSDYLVSRGLLTHWQCRVLIQGRSKEFFLGNFKFLNQIATDGRTESYLVDDLGTNRQLILSFPIRPTDMAGTIYRVIRPAVD
jgi:hypothetical protein